MKTTLVLSLLLVSFLLNAQNTLISFSGIKPLKENPAPIRNIIDNGVEGIQVSYHFDALSVNNKLHKSEVYQQLSIPNFSHIQEVGKPAMPAHIDLIAIPEGADYELVISHDVAMVKKGFKIYPALQAARDTEGAPEPSFEINDDFYSTNQLYPLEPVIIKEIVTIKGLRYALVQISPVQYNPATGHIFLHQNLNFELKFKSANRFIDCRKHSEQAMKILSNYPLNGQSIQKEAKDYFAGANGILNTTGNGKNYIIITHSNFQAAADSLAMWKRQMGYTVEVVSANSWTTTQVNNAVHTRYDNWSPKPDYLVIIGDHQFVPAKMLTNSNGDQFGTDLYYVCMDGTGDYVPDMAKGRISANTAADALLQVAKMINYERNPISDTTFYQNGLNCAQFQDDNNDGYADRRFAHTSEDIRNYTLSQGYNVERIYYASSSVTPLHYNNGYYSNGQSIPSVLKKSNGYAWNGNSTMIKNSINAGKFYVFHRDHGYSGGYGWAHPYFVNSSISSLSNGDKLPVVFSINCHTGEFTQTSCFAETFMRKSNGGAVGVVGASYYSYSGYNDGFSIGLVDAIWSNPGIVPVFGNGGISNPNVQTHSDIVTMGDVVNHGLVREIQTWGGSSSGIRYTHELFHYFGDPAMRIWTDVPQDIVATFDTLINCTDTVLQITNCNDSNATVTLIGNNQLLAKVVLQNGSGNLPLFALQGSSFVLTITGRDMRPLMSTINMGAGGVFSAFNSVTPVACKGDSVGEIKVFPACGTPPYHISWSNGDSSMILSNLTAGSYIYTLTDSTNAVIIDTILVMQPAVSLQANATINDVKCYFQSTGSINLNIQGGTTPYSCQWNGGSTSTSLTNISANTYTVTITDSLGCQIQESYTVNQPPPLNLTPSYTDDLTNNCSGTATIAVTGGVTPYTYQWNDPNAQTTPTATGLCKGLYKVTVNDSNQCVSYRTILIDNTVGMEESTTTVSIAIFPNPSNDGVFSLNINSDIANDFQLVVYNNLGKRIYEKTIRVNGDHLETLNLNNAAAGVYYLQIHTDNQLIDSRNLIIR
jgi:hypothetical protein